MAAYAAGYGLTPGQRAGEDKGNEITAIKELLPSLALSKRKAAARNHDDLAALLGLRMI